MRYKLLIFFLIVFSSFQSVFSYNWEMNFEAHRHRFLKTVYVDSLNFGALALTVNVVPKFYLTTDGGASWSQRFTDEETFLVPEFRQHVLRPLDLSKASDTDFFISCENGFFLNSTNGGKNWSRIASNYDTTNFLKISMLNKKMGIASSHTTLYVTEDGCHTFTPIHLNLFLDVLNNIWDIVYIDSTTMLIVGTSNALRTTVLYYSNNSGKTWQPLQNNVLLTGLFSNMINRKMWMWTQTPEQIDNRTHIFGKFLYSDDGGLTWEEQFKIHGDSLAIVSYIHFSDENNGIIVGTAGTIFMTTNGGKNWERHYHSNDSKDRPFFQTCLSTSPSTAFVFTDQGFVYKYDKLIASIANNYDDIDISIYPNPASDYITINYKPSEGLEPSEGYRVQIFDMLGIEVAQTPSSVNNMKNTQTGASELLRIDVSHLPAGVYFIKVNCSNGACSIVEKFVKM